MGLRIGHRGEDAGFCGVFRKDRKPWGFRRQPCNVCGRRVFGAGGICAETGGLCAEFFENDISPSIDAGDFAGTGLSEFPNYGEAAISQVRAKGNRSSDKRKGIRVVFNPMGAVGFPWGVLSAGMRLIGKNAYEAGCSVRVERFPNKLVILKE